MAEFPMMPFWGNDFYGDKNVIVMDAEQIGAYHNLIWFAWQNNGEVPNDPETLMRISRVRPDGWQRVWGRVKPCWREQGTGVQKVLVNDRVLDELKKAKKWLDDKSKAGVASVKARGYRHINRRTSVQASVKQPLEQMIEHTGCGCGIGILIQKDPDMERVHPPWPRADFDAAAKNLSCPDAERDKCWSYYDSQQWEKGNGCKIGGDPRSLLTTWLANPKRFEQSVGNGISNKEHDRKRNAAAEAMA